jgi:hypothetical protein
MNPEEQNRKNSELDTLLLILDSYKQLPVDFCLKEFLGWDDTKIKTFNKERKKTKRIILKEYAKMSKSISSVSCCGTTSQG